MAEPTPADPPLVEPHGDDAVLVTFGDTIDEAVNRRVHAAAAAIRRASAAGAPWRMPIPAYASLLVGYDPLQLAGDAALAGVAALVGEVTESGQPGVEEAVLEVEVRYGGDAGPDLDDVAERTGLNPAQVIALHTSVVYRAYMLGFAPGFAYLGQLPAALELPRRSTPRQRVAAGSVAIAGRQTAVYPLSTPGGWHLIGRTEMALWDADRSPPALITPGRLVRFVARA